MAFGLLKAAESSSVCEPNHSMDLQAERARNGETDRARDGEYVTKKKRSKKKIIMSNEKERGFCAAGGTLSPSWHLCFAAAAHCCRFDSFTCENVYYNVLINALKLTVITTANTRD